MNKTLSFLIMFVHQKIRLEWKKKTLNEIVMWLTDILFYILHSSLLPYICQAFTMRVYFCITRFWAQLHHFFLGSTHPCVGPQDEKEMTILNFKIGLKKTYMFLMSLFTSDIIMKKQNQLFNLSCSLVIFSYVHKYCTRIIIHYFTLSIILIVTMILFSTNSCANAKSLSKWEAIYYFSFKSISIVNANFLVKCQ